MKNAKTLICSLSTISWVASFLSDTIETVYFPNHKNRARHETFCKPIENTIYYDYKICSKIELENFLFDKTNDIYSAPDFKGKPIINKVLKYLNYMKNGYYIEIGAYNGIYQSNTKCLEDDYNWNGILIEPSPRVFIELEKNRPNNVNINKALVSKDYIQSTIYGFFDDGPMSSIYQRTEGNKNLISIEACTMNNILEQLNIIKIDLLSIDTGYDFEILQGFDLIKYKPTFIVIELKKNKDFMIEYLKINNYELIENLSNYNKIDNPGWSEDHNDYLFKYNNLSNNLFDIVIPCGPNDINKLHEMIKHTKKNIVGYRNIYIVSYDKNIYIDGCITIDEKIYPFNINTIEKHLGKNERNGWYLQQLLKLYAGFTIKDILNNYLVIDTDTFFMKPTIFFENETPLYNFGTEYHIPYFQHMIKLHPTLIKQNEKSGICHHMIFQKDIILELFKLTENYHKKYFYKVFLECVDPMQILGSGCSEYEIYFNYIQIYYKNKYKIRKLNWCNSKYLIENQNYDYISCHWYL
jgi:FkbM family methyltransferase